MTDPSPFVSSVFFVVPLPWPTTNHTNYTNNRLSLYLGHSASRPADPSPALADPDDRSPIRVIRVFRGPPPLANHESHELRE